MLMQRVRTCLLAVVAGSAALGAQGMPTTGLLSFSTDAHGYYDSGVPPREEGRNGQDGFTALATAATTLGGVASMGFSNGAKADAAASASMGVLRTRSSAGFPSDRSGGYITGSARASFADYLPLGPRGTVTTYTFLYHVTGTHTVPGFELGGTFSANAVANVSVTDDLGTVLTWIPAGWTSTDLEFDHLFSATFTVTSAHDAAYLTIGASLDVLAYVSGDSAYRFADADYSGTGRFELLASPGGNTVGVSGHDYAVRSTDPTGIPEPPAPALLAVAAALGLWQTRRRRAGS